MNKDFWKGYWTAWFVWFFLLIVMTVLMSCGGDRLESSPQTSPPTLEWPAEEDEAPSVEEDDINEDTNECKKKKKKGSC